MKKTIHNKTETTSCLWLMITVMLVFIMSCRAPIDSDMWWHLRAGEETWISGHPYLVDTLSFTRAGETWVSHSWLTDLMMFLVFNYGGYLFLCAGVALLASLTMVVVYQLMDAPPSFRSFSIVLGSMICSPTWTPRPQVFSLFLLACSGWIIHLFKTKNRDLLFLFPIIFMFWSNLHGGYPIGLLYIGIFIFGDLTNIFFFKKPAESLPVEKIKKMIFWALVSCVATLINPNGIDIWFVPFKTISMQANQLITEWASPDFHQLFQHPFLWQLFGIFLFMTVIPSQVNFTTILMMISFAYMGLVSRRNFGSFAIVTTPFFADYGWRAWIFIKGKLSGYPFFETISSYFLTGQQLKIKNTKIINLCLIFCLGFVAIFKLYFVSSPVLVNTYESKSFPTKAIEWIKVNRPAGNLLNEYNWGGYLSYHLRDYKVYIDPRADLYGDDFIIQWAELVNGNNKSSDLLDQWNINLVLIYPNRGLQFILLRDGWKVLYLDEQAIILGR